jgi:DNA-directed RNA polymerase specialized sigma24 family protein
VKGEPVAYVRGHNPRGKSDAPPISSLPLPEAQQRPGARLRAEEAAVTEALWLVAKKALLRRFAGVFGDLAEDHVQDTFVRICESLRDRPDSSNLRAWVNRIADNLAIDKHRRNTALHEALERLKLETILRSPTSERALLLARPRRSQPTLNSQ